MGSDELALRALLRDTIGVALVWSPSLWALRQSDPTLAKLRIISPKPLPESTVDVGATLLAFTDGLVERRGEVLDVGLARLRNFATKRSGLHRHSAWFSRLSQ